MPRRIYGDWITVRVVALPNDVQAGILNCGHCGHDMQVQFPIEINNLWALSSAFGNIHNSCEEPEDAA
jgi:hypothetical protein